MPSVPLKAFVGGSHGHCWVELRYLLCRLQYTMSTCRWVKARSPHADKGRFVRFRQALQTCPTTTHDANSRIFGVDTFRSLRRSAPTADVERTSELCASLADSGTSVVVDGSTKVLRALGSNSWCCYEAEDEGVQVTTVAMLVWVGKCVVDNWFAGSGKQVTVQTKDVAALLHRLP